MPGTEGGDAILVAMFDRLYRRVRIGSEEHGLLDRSWFSFDSEWEGLPMVLRAEIDDGWVVYGFSEIGPPDEVIDLLIGEPCDERGKPL